MIQGQTNIKFTRKYAEIPLNSRNNKITEVENTSDRIQGLVTGQVSSTEVP